MQRTRRALTAVVVAGGLAACASSAEGIAAQDAWARVSPDAAEFGAIYLVLANDGEQDDRLVSASVELHETTASEDTAEGDMAMMGMREVEAIDVLAGGTVTLEPGGLHVMLIGLAGPLEEGDTIPVTLEFDQAGEQTVDAEVRASG